MRALLVVAALTSLTVLLASPSGSACGTHEVHESVPVADVARAWVDLAPPCPPPNAEPGAAGAGVETPVFTSGLYVFLPAVG